MVGIEEFYFAGGAGGEEEVAGRGEEAHLGYGGAGLLFPGEDVLLGHVAFEVIREVAAVMLLLVPCHHSRGRGTHVKFMSKSCGTCIYVRP